MSFPWRTQDGEARAARAWRKAESQAVLACVHGLGGAAEEFEPLAHAFPNYSVYAFELRGQGLDPLPRRRGAELDVAAQHRDIRAFLAALREVHPTEPIFLVGESMGALLAASFAARYPEADVAGAILSVPVVALRKPLSPALRRAVRWVAEILPSWRLRPLFFVKRTSQRSMLTRDEAYRLFLDSRPHKIRHFTIKFLSDLGELMAGSAHVAETLRLPTLVLSAENDCFVSSEQVRQWFEKIASKDKTLQNFSEAYHLLWHDHDHILVLSEMRAWIEQRLPAPAVALPSVGRL